MIPNRLIEDITEIRKKFEEEFQKSGKQFNLFSILKVERNEVNTHSRFIAELLDPKGRHGQGDLFLKEFLGCVAILNFETSKAKVSLEYWIGPISKDGRSGGRIDILIESAEKFILIENKIDAGEQPNQLERYHNFCPNNSGLFYLTLFGEDSKTSCLKKEQYNPISYKENIIQWLESCSGKVEKLSVLYEAIQQYIQLVKKITNQNQGKKFNKKMVEKVLGSEDNFASFVALTKIQNEIYQAVFSENILPALEAIAKAKSLDLKINKNKFLKKSGAWHSFYFINEDLKKKNLKIQFSFLQKTKLTGFIFGISRLDGAEGISDDFKKNIIKIFTEVFSSPQISSWICYKVYDEYNDWEDLDTLKKIKFGNFESDMGTKIDQLIRCCEIFEKK